MEAETMIKERRSVRRYRNEKVDRELMREIIDLSRWAPSWSNYQIARYTLVDDPALIERFMTDGVKGFIYNIKTLKNAPGVAVLSFVKGKSGKIDVEKAKKAELSVDDEGFATEKKNIWEVFDAGIACQTFCLAAHARGVGTCIFGVIDDTGIAQAVDLPEDETVAALVTYGYPDERPDPTPRKDADRIVRFL